MVFFYVDGNTPLHQSAFKGDEKIVKILLNYNANSNITNLVFGKSPLHYAVEYDHEEVVKLLLKNNANPSLKDKTERSPLDIATGAIKSLLLKPSQNSSRSPKSSPLSMPSPGPIDEVLQASEKNPDFNIKLGNNEEYNEKHDVSISTIFEPDAEKSQIEIRPSKAFSFGGCDGKSLMAWLENVKLDCLYDNLMNAGYDDVEQMAAQMISGMPITEESLCKIGIQKPGHRRRLLAALDEETRPFKSSRRTHRSQQSNPLKCCMASVPVNIGFNSAPDLDKWLFSMGLGNLFKLFEDAGYDDLEHMLALMNSRWEINEKILAYEIGIKQQAYRYKILARLKNDCFGFETMKKGGVTSRYRRDDLSIEKTTNSTPCNFCAIY